MRDNPLGYDNTHILVDRAIEQTALNYLDLVIAFAFEELTFVVLFIVVGTISWDRRSSAKAGGEE